MFKSVLGTLLLLGPVWVVACNNDDEQPSAMSPGDEGGTGGATPDQSEAGAGGTRMQFPLDRDGCPDWDFWEDVNDRRCDDDSVRCSFTFVCGIGEAVTTVDTLSCDDGWWTRGKDSAPCTCPTDLRAADGTSCRGFEPGYQCPSGQDFCDEPDRRCTEDGIWQAEEPTDCGGAGRDAGGAAAGGAAHGGVGGAH